MLGIIVNKSIVDMLWTAECQEVDMSTFVDLCSGKGILSETAEYPHPLTSIYAIALS